MSPHKQPEVKNRHESDEIVQEPGNAGLGQGTVVPAFAPDTVTGRIPIIDVAPVVRAGGQFPAKAVVGEAFTVAATVFREGHDALGANVVVCGPGGRTLGWLPMRYDEPGTDRWSARIRPDAEGAWTYTVEAWSDPFGTWSHAAEIKVPAGVDVELMLAEGALVLERAANNLPEEAEEETALLRAAVKALLDTSRPAEARLHVATAPEVRDLLAVHPLRDLVTRSQPFPLWVDRERALYGSWYEFFPRSEGAYYSESDGVWVSGTFKTAAERLPAVAAMGFDVVYLPPIHPIGRVNRKGPNNTLEPGPGDPGSPWAIGAEEGGHDAVHPDLGTLEDFDAFVARARELGLEIALDLALQAAPDHPWVKEHPEWFTTLSDGSIAHAENPPKKYQDIYPLNFDNDPEGLYAEVLRVVRHWMDHGVRVFRVDNPHTKPVQFWEWLLAQVRTTDPDVLFLSEAFTRPPMMRTLAKVGFHQSYTYFTWRNTKDELQSYLTELSQETSAFLRPNFFVNTQDILTEYLQYGGPAAFKIRAALAATLSPTWGVYSGFELCEHLALRPGSEEYFDSEKYQFRPRDWPAYEPGRPHEGQSIAPYIRALNEIRRRHPALQRLRNLRFHYVPDDSLLVFSKRELLPDDTGGVRDDTVIVVVNLDPHATRESVVSLTMPDLGMNWQDSFVVHDELTGDTWRWGQHNYIRLDPSVQPAHILKVSR
ncbi:alpha-1,4-glucan--maltose-1-phosphate maltosyltransferase [Actinopolymorpha alba]|uniref:alpha-1,4-glucan--maltose-1-phosphate maltosyltransferase n=1 Tax=Actinopolymorpha alba TaxID=533267 RepID=UPI0003793402|nr:alpha-1,4-glucan--maltose-1-phosphate maltosyltransferase [Actinopolymorpha alba]